MKYAIFLALFTAGFSVLAQQITRDQVYQIGDRFEFVHFEETSDPGPSGANQSWDFSSLTPNGHANDVNEYLALADTPDAGTFSNATIVERVTATEGVSYQYFDASSSDFLLIGVNAEDILVPYQDTHRVFAFPFAFGTSWQDTFGGPYTTNGVTVDRSGQCAVEGDATGTLTLPGGLVFNNVIRMKIEMEITDSVLGTNIVTNTRTYLWWSPNFKVPLLNISMIESSAAPGVSTVVRILQDAINGDGGGGNQDEQTRWVSHITREGAGFDTNIFVTNTSEIQQSIDLKGYDDNGNLVMEKSVVLDAGQVLMESQAVFFSGQAVSHMEVNGSTAMKIVTGFRASGGGATAHVPASPQRGKFFRVYPGEQDVVFDGMAVMNVGEAATSVVARMKDTQGNIVAEATVAESLGSFAKGLAVFSSLFPDRRDAVIEIESAQDLAVTFLRGSWPGTSPAYLYANLPQTVDPVNRWIPHVTRDGGGFQTTLYINNLADVPALITLKPFDSNGLALSERTLQFQNQQLLIENSADLFNGEPVSHFQIEGDAQIAVSVAYKVAEGLGASAHLPETSDVRNQFYVFPGEQNLIFDGMALVNVGDGPATVTAQLSGNGEQQQATLTEGLAPNAKFLAVFSSVFTDLENKIIRIDSDQPLAVMFLRGTPLGVSPAFLYANQPLPK